MVAPHSRLTWMALSLLPVSPGALRKALEDTGGDPDAALARLAPQPEILNRQAEELRPRLEKARIKVLTRGDPAYPALLEEIDDPPPVLYVRGDMVEADDPAVAIVGSRRASPYGLAMARILARDLAAAGVTVVSGLARGIDAAAHGGALAATGGRALAVLGSGPDIIYPPEHRRLATAVAAHGALLSEFPPGTPPLPRHFPWRNRIISGLARGVVVVEAAAGSGSLITARLALDQGREVYAVPGPVTAPGSHGTHDLLRQGARLTTSAADVVDEFPADIIRQVARRIAIRRKTPPPDLEPGAREVWNALDPAISSSIDDLARRTGLAVPALVSALLGLELRGLARAFPGPRYARGGLQEGQVSYIDTASGPNSDPHAAGPPPAGKGTREP
ncbi:MAG: DNA-processing protein DprA [Acidobacteria bacterium]|nr:DNA-processing protein DprA [Acidobacteriota bacterium]